LCYSCFIIPLLSLIQATDVSGPHLILCPAPPPFYPTIALLSPIRVHVLRFQCPDRRCFSAILLQWYVFFLPFQSLPTHGPFSIPPSISQSLRHQPKSSCSQGQSSVSSKRLPADFVAPPEPLIRYSTIPSSFADCASRVTSVCSLASTKPLFKPLRTSCSLALSLTLPLAFCYYALHHLLTSIISSNPRRTDICPFHHCSTPPAFYHRISSLQLLQRDKHFRSPACSASASPAPPCCNCS
jgi:hypothetical protein